MALGWHTEPGCIQHNLPAGDVYKPYEKCADFFTFGHGSTAGTFAHDVNASYWVLTVVGIAVMVFFIVAWVVTEDRKLRRQSAHLLVAGAAGQVELSRETPAAGSGGPA